MSRGARAVAVRRAASGSSPSPRWRGGCWRTWSGVGSRPGLDRGRRRPRGDGARHGGGRSPDLAPEAEGARALLGARGGVSAGGRPAGARKTQPPRVRPGRGVPLARVRRQRGGAPGIATGNGAGAGPHSEPKLGLARMKVLIHSRLRDASGIFLARPFRVASQKLSFYFQALGRAQS